MSTNCSENTTQLPEKSCFAHTFSMLRRHYLKEKATSAENSAGVTEIFRKFANPMNLFPVADQSSNCSNEDIPKTAAASSPNMMTIFYGGQVIVFNDFPRGKAKEIIHLLASKAKPQMFSVKNPSLDLPIARRNSLQSFLEKKRKDRTAARSPYAVPREVSRLNEKSWLTLAA